MVRPVERVRSSAEDHCRTTGPDTGTRSGRRIISRPGTVPLSHADEWMRSPCCAELADRTDTPSEARPGKRSGAVPDLSETASDLHFPSVGLTGFEPATP